MAALPCLMKMGGTIKQEIVSISKNRGTPPGRYEYRTGQEVAKSEGLK